MVIAGVGRSQPMPVHPSPEPELYSSARRGCMPCRPGGTSNGYDNRADPRWFAVGDSMTLTPAAGSPAFKSLIWLGLNCCPSGCSGTSIAVVLVVPLLTALTGNPIGDSPAKISASTKASAPLRRVKTPLLMTFPLAGQSPVAESFNHGTELRS